MKLKVVKNQNTKMMDFNLAPFTVKNFNEYKMQNNVFNKSKGSLFFINNTF